MGLFRLIMRKIILVFISVLLPLLSIGQTFTPSKAQKGVAKSTDALVIGLPVAALTGVLVQKDWKGLIQGVETAGATAAATLILKYSIKEMRPDYSNMHSFPSGHSSISFATAAFIQRRYGWAVGGPAYALSCYVAWGRVFAKKHHVWDVCAGAVIGAASAYIFTTPFAKKHNLQIAPTADATHIGEYASFEF